MVLGGGLQDLGLFGGFGEGFLQKNFALSGFQPAHVGFETVI